MTDRTFDPVLLEILWTRLRSIVDEAAKAIVRTSFSTLSNEANDFSCVLTDSRGLSIAQNTGSIPSFIATLPATVRHFLRELGAETMRPGDVLITNNPWQGTGHLNDITIVKPIFVGGQLVAFSSTTAHVPDIGGRIRSAEAREVFEEGFHIPLMHLIRAGEVDETLLKLLRTNVRTPEQTQGDVFAQVAANELMEARLVATMADYGLTGIDRLADELYARSEQAMRAAIAAVPDGIYRYTMRTDGIEVPFVFAAAVHVRGDSILVDFAGTSPQQPRAINCVLAYTYAMTAFAIKAALLPNLPNNEGMFRPIAIDAPEGSLLNPRFPASVGGRSSTGHYVPTVVLGALEQVIPERVMAGAGSPLWNLTLAGVRASGPDAGKPFASVLFFNGGMGGTATQDGESALSWPSNISSTPCEITERDSPLFTIHKRLVPGSGGRGQFRGGLGQEVLMQNRHPTPIAVIFLAERLREPAPGMHGGEAGGRGDVQVNGQSLADSKRQIILHTGDTVQMRTPGGGGFGEPARRSAAAIARDITLGYC
ncbi:MAG: hydantoinase B/oxoprolinase family protein [Proteobacteria bacterium]|nr:hydantoinase B/oxoprolinase family protein [Burkholderiales bacterium]